GQTGTAKAIKEQIDALNDQIAEATTNSIVAAREAFKATAQEAVDKASFATTVGQAQFAILEAQQRRDKTYETAGGAQARQDFIRSTIIPQLNAEAEALKKQAATDYIAGDTKGAQDAMLAYMAKIAEATQAS